MLKDIIFVFMRLKGTKYEQVHVLPTGALPVGTYAREHGISSPSYVCVKYDRFKEGYTKKDGSKGQSEDPGYKIVCYHGTNYVIDQPNVNNN